MKMSKLIYATLICYLGYFGASAQTSSSFAASGGSTNTSLYHATALSGGYSDGLSSFSAIDGYAHGQYSMSFGRTSQSLGDYSNALGGYTFASGEGSTALGWYVRSTGRYSMTLGMGNYFFQVPFVNSVDYSLMIGFNSSLPSVFVGHADPDKMPGQKFGFVGIGTSTPKYELSVNGSIIAKSAVFVENLPGEWPDYVFSKDYSLMPLQEVEKFIEVNRHLPGVPSQEEIKKEGLNLGEMEMIMMKKIEELTLHMIQIEKENKLIQSENASLKSQVKELQNRK
ncbi:hypothetical protein WSM22_39110 [Cytophagales bacterium WSM2-2]|nr:hypothetical protein WSM22_39110 [Cytophagales bacterium WSM2-2]